MRTFFLFGTLAAALGAFAGDLIVVVYTTDAKVVRYTCANDVQNPYAGGSVVMRTDHQRGGAQWHAVGGVPPYKLVGYENAGGLVAVTMMDAVGNVATGLGAIGQQVQEVVANCRCWRGGELVSSALPASKRGQNASCSDPRPGHRAIPSPERDGRTSTHVSDRGTRTTSTSSRVITSRPERPAPASSGRTGTARTIDR